MTKQDTMLDPFAIWKSMYENTEASLSEAIHETLKKESFAEWLGHLQGGFLQYQQMVQDTTDAYLKQINMPTREEISNIASLIINVEEKVECLDEKLDDELLNNQTVNAEITKLTDSVSKLEKKLDLILQSLSKEEAAPVAASSTKEKQKKA